MSGAFLADESVDAAIVQGLRDRGFDVLYIAELNPGIPDSAVLERANQGNALLLTEDKDFGELVFRRREIASGVVLIRLAGLSSDHQRNLVLAAMDQHGDELLGGFSVISPGSIRIRARIFPAPEPTRKNP